MIEACQESDERVHGRLKAPLALLAIRDPRDFNEALEALSTFTEQA